MASFFILHDTQKKFVLWNGTSLLSAGGIKGIKGFLKGIIILGADKYIAYGKKAKEYLEYFGAKTDKIYVGCNTVDMDYLQNNVTEYRNKESIISERNKYPKYLILCVSQLIKRKAIIQILKAMDRLRDSRFGLIIAGNGPKRLN